MAQLWICLTIFGMKPVYNAYLDVQPGPRKYSCRDQSSDDNRHCHDRPARRIFKVGLNARRRRSRCLIIDVLAHLVHATFLLYEMRSLQSLVWRGIRVSRPGDVETIKTRLKSVTKLLTAMESEQNRIADAPRRYMDLIITPLTQATLHAAMLSQ